MPGTNNLTLKEWWRVGCDGNNLADAVSGGIYTANSGGGGGSKSIQATWKRHSCGYEPKTRAYGTALAGARPFLQRGSQLTGGKPPGPPGTHL